MSMPWVVLLLGGLLGLWFHRGRVFLAMAALAAADEALARIAMGPVEGMSRTAIYDSVCLLLPAVLAALAIGRERRWATAAGLVQPALVLLPAAFVYWVALPDHPQWMELMRYHFFEPESLPWRGLSQPAAIGALVSALVVLGAWIRRPTILRRGFLVALLLVPVGLDLSPQDPSSRWYLWAAGAALVLSVLQEGYRLAYLDELTQLPGRRALVEDTQRLGRRYSIAMLDVDHFKKFNDRYGHDVGDQVLRFLAVTLKKVGGGGKAFRYGGEEFTILFPGKSAEEVKEPLEALRAAVEASRLTIRGPGRPKHKPETPPPAKSSLQQVSVTVSIGVAERAAHHARPFEVLKDADQALYRAKKRGRNQLSL